MKPQKTIRGKAEHLGGTKVRYTWPCGHTQVRDHSKGPVPKRIGELGLRFLTRYWNNSGVNLPLCKKCNK